jgi:hypothetical protein
MRKLYITILVFLMAIVNAICQPSYNQYFDGEDTSASNSLIIRFDTSGSNLWQIGRPQKIIFDSSATLPNAIVTDTVNIYPINNTSSFNFTVVPWINWGLLAVQWKEKLDMDLHHDGGIIEYSVDAGQTWSNVFNNPGVYNFYGYLPQNQDTLLTGEYALSGTDSSWRDVWFCVDMSWIGLQDSIMLRFTFKSDSIDNNKEGWMIDNMMAHVSLMHPVKETDKKDYMSVYPNPTKDILNIEMEKIQDFHIIEEMQFIDPSGKIVAEWKNIPTKFWFDTKKYAAGLYYLKVKTNLKSETIPVLVKKE